jgi:ribonucleoside-triphosphate reductase
LFSFRLPQDFVDGFRNKAVPWGFQDAGGNSFGEIVFTEKYSRVKEDGSKETWDDVCRRVIEGTFSIQKDYAKSNRLPWNDRKAQATAQDAYVRMRSFKWLPPGRGLWMMGTPLVMEQRNSAALQNCAFISTKEMSKNNPAKPFAWLMEASMLGIGVGMDTYGHGDRFEIHRPDPDDTWTYVIGDDRESWVESARLLINSYLRPGRGVVLFDYDLIRKEGEPIKTFGGTAAGPEPLKRLHQAIRDLFSIRSVARVLHEVGGLPLGSIYKGADSVGFAFTSVDVADLANLIGVCVVAGNVRRSAELLMGLPTDPTFLDLKNADVMPDRQDWGWMSNNSLSVSVGQDYSPFVDAVVRNGEPGFIWMDITRAYGRLIDPPDNKDWRAAGYNPCAEQSLESMECCTLVETFISRHESLEDYKATLKVAYLYAKTVTLLPTHWEETNAIMQRNRRIGTSVSGVAEFADREGMSTLKTWLNTGYQIVRAYDKTYSEWLCVRESIKTTTVKPSGTVSQLAGTTPGVHWAPGGKYFLRALRISVLSPLVPLLEQAGYLVEPEKYDPQGTVVAYFPIKSGSSRPEGDVTIWEKANLAVVAQRYWSDNSVSVTVSFDPESEGMQIGNLLHMVEGQLKTISFLPKGNKVYDQQPYTEISKDEYASYVGRLGRVDMSVLYAPENAVEAIGEAFCTTDSCEVPR